MSDEKVYENRLDELHKWLMRWAENIGSGNVTIENILEDIAIHQEDLTRRNKDLAEAGDDMVKAFEKIHDDAAGCITPTKDTLKRIIGYSADAIFAWERLKGEK